MKPKLHRIAEKPIIAHQELDIPILPGMQTNFSSTVNISNKLSTAIRKIFYNVLPNGRNCVLLPPCVPSYPTVSHFLHTSGQLFFAEHTVSLLAVAADTRELPLTENKATRPAAAAERRGAGCNILPHPLGLPLLTDGRPGAALRY